MQTKKNAKKTKKSKILNGNKTKKTSYNYFVETSRERTYNETSLIKILGYIGEGLAPSSKKAAFILYLKKGDEYIELLGFKEESEAKNLKRYLKKILRLAFKEGLEITYLPKK